MLEAIRRFIAFLRHKHLLVVLDNCEHVIVAAGSLAEAIAHDGPAVVDVVVTRDPAAMLPGVDSRARPTPTPGDRIA